jgi:hypothetical protein
MASVFRISAPHGHGLMDSSERHAVGLRWFTALLNIRACDAPYVQKETRHARHGMSAVVRGELCRTVSKVCI